MYKVTCKFIPSATLSPAPAGNQGWFFRFAEKKTNTFCHWMISGRRQKSNNLKKLIFIVLVLKRKICASVVVLCCCLRMKTVAVFLQLPVSQGWLQISETNTYLPVLYLHCNWTAPHSFDPLWEHRLVHQWEFSTSFHQWLRSGLTGSLEPIWSSKETFPHPNITQPLKIQPDTFRILPLCFSVFVPLTTRGHASKSYQFL